MIFFDMFLILPFIIGPKIILWCHNIIMIVNHYMNAKRDLYSRGLCQQKVGTQEIVIQNVWKFTIHRVVFNHCLNLRYSSLKFLWNYCAWAEHSSMIVTPFSFNWYNYFLISACLRFLRRNQILCSVNNGWKWYTDAADRVTQRHLALKFEEAQNIW